MHSIRAVTTTCFRLFLQHELAARQARNPQYSLRAFAKRLDVDHATLSQWLRGRRPMTRRTIETLARRLRLPAKQVRVFVEHRAPEGPDLAILELTRRRGFRADTRWIAAQLDVSVDEANIALHRLLHLDLLRMDAADRWIDTSEAR
jgi:transcriptional regulator with XRE-family HTH domain